MQRLQLGPAIALLVLAGACTPSSQRPPDVFSVPPTAMAFPTASPRSSTSTPAPIDAAVRVVLDGLGTPVAVLPIPGRSDLVVLEQTGQAWLLRDGRLLSRPVFDVRSELVHLDPGYDERGLLGLAFDPAFASNGRIWVYYSARLRVGAEPSMNHTNRLSVFHLAPDADAVDPGSERVVLQFEQPQPNHNGGGVGFGSDGLLYLGVGDGGGEGDASPGHSPQGNAQDPQKLNGKILRIDVSQSTPAAPYAIPADNPFASGGGRPEIYALGFRNPWRISWEATGQRRLLASDVGYGRYEEIDAVVPGGNYGWRIREGAHCLDIRAPLTEVTGCPTTAATGVALIDPVLEYRHTQVGIAVVGGFVYAGGRLPALRDQYVFGDLTRDWVGAVPKPRATIMVATPSDAASWSWRQLRLQAGLIPSFLTGLGQDANGEVLLLVRNELGPTGQTGRILELVPPGA